MNITILGSLIKNWEQTTARIRCPICSDLFEAKLSLYGEPRYDGECNHVGNPTFYKVRYKFSIDPQDGFERIYFIHNSIDYYVSHVRSGEYIETSIGFGLNQNMVKLPKFCLDFSSFDENSFVTKIKSYLILS